MSIRNWQRIFKCHLSKHSKSYENINKIQTVLFTAGETEPITSSTSVEPEVGYDCDDYNPCTPENAAEGKFYFPHKDPTKYVQCSENEQCYVMNCSSGLVWDSAINACHLSPITTSTTSSPSTAPATTGVDGTTTMGALIQYFVCFYSYLTSGLCHAKTKVWPNLFWHASNISLEPQLKCCSLEDWIQTQHHLRVQLSSRRCSILSGELLSLPAAD